MYKYFSELEKPSDFKTYLVRKTFDKNQDLFISNITFSDNLLKKLGVLFPKLYKIDELIITLNEELIMKMTECNLLAYETCLSNEDFFQHKDECYFESHYDLRKK